jgi:hypothetical protein
MNTVIIVSVILFIFIVGSTIMHITKGYKYMPSNNDVDPMPERDQSVADQDQQKSNQE